MSNRGGDFLSPLIIEIMKTKVDIRVFSIEQAVRIMGVGTPQKDVVAKAQEIEEYITKGVELPDVDTDSSTDIVNSIVQMLNAAAEK